MTAYTIKPSPDKKMPGFVIEHAEFGKVCLVNGGMVLPENEARAYCDRLNKLFGGSKNG